MTAATINESDRVDTGRDINPYETLRQIAPPNLMAISGGRWQSAGTSAIDLPCGSGYRVRIILAADDTYTVQRWFFRDGVGHWHGEVSEVYCDEVSETAYYASCYRSYDDEQWVWKAAGVA